MLTAMKETPARGSHAGRVNRDSVILDQSVDFDPQPPHTRAPAATVG
jgi:hypothetical protein